MKLFRSARTSRGSRNVRRTCGVYPNDERAELTLLVSEAEETCDALLAITPAESKESFIWEDAYEAASCDDESLFSFFSGERG